MLVELQCDRFRHKSIHFGPGLNVIEGDDRAANSIGKSLLLMIVDFAHGGTDFIKKHPEVFGELGHHDYRFVFRFGSSVYRFIRNTQNPEFVAECDSNWSEKRELELEAYNNLLSSLYLVADTGLSFRSLCSVHTRIWGRENLDTSKPLNAVAKQSDSIAVDRLLKIFRAYGQVENVAESVKEADTELKAIRGAQKNRLMKKIGRTEYQKNVAAIGEIDTELQDIQANLKQYSLNIASITNRQVVDLKTRKDELLRISLELKLRLKRLESNLKLSGTVTSKDFGGLREYFSDFNEDKASQVEMFHKKISSILKSEMKASKVNATAELEEVELEIAEIDKHIEKYLRPIEDPSAIVDRVYKLSTQHTSMKQEIAIYEKEAELKNRLAQLKAELNVIYERQLRKIQREVNSDVAEMVREIYSGTRKPPNLEMESNRYSYQTYEDTGAGKAYASMVILDLVLFQKTCIPFLVHDTIVYKNIENEAVSRLLEVYAKIEKQSFISLDEVPKYGQRAIKIVERTRAIKLTNDSVLFDKDWRK